MSSGGGGGCGLSAEFDDPGTTPTLPPPLWAEARLARLAAPLNVKAGFWTAMI